MTIKKKPVKKSVRRQNDVENQIEDQVTEAVEAVEDAEKPEMVSSASEVEESEAPTTESDSERDLELKHEPEADEDPSQEVEVEGDETEPVETDEEVEQEPVVVKRSLDLSILKNMQSEQSTGLKLKKAAILLINHPNGRRMEIAGDIMDQLGSPESVQVSHDGSSIYIGEQFTDGVSYNVKRKNETSKGIIYAANLIRDLTNDLNLNFEGVSSQPYGNVEYIEVEDRTIAVVSR